MLRREPITRPLDEAPCDGCGRPLRVGDTAVVNLNLGTIYCGKTCAHQDRPRNCRRPERDTAA